MLKFACTLSQGAAYAIWREICNLARHDRLSGRGAARADDAQGTPTQSHRSPSILVYEDYTAGISVRILGKDLSRLNARLILVRRINPGCRVKGLGYGVEIVDGQADHGQANQTCV